MIFTVQVLENVKVVKEIDRETLINVARTSLCTKVDKEIAEILTEVSTEQKKKCKWWASRFPNFIFYQEHNLCLRYVFCCHELGWGGGGGGGGGGMLRIIKGGFFWFFF